MHLAPTLRSVKLKRMPQKRVPIYIAVYLADLSMPWVRSLKEKRSIIKPMTEKMKVRFPVSVARVDGLNAHSWERIAVTAVSQNAEWLEQLLERIHRFVCAQASYEVKVVDSAVELWDLNDL